MKFSLLQFGLLVFFVTSVLAQNNNSITGSVSNNNLPVEYANVLLTTTTDSTKIINATITDSIGGFSLTAVKTGNYLLKIQFTGYITATQKIVIDSANTHIKLPTIILRANNKMLKLVEITTYKDLVKKTTTGLIISTKDNLTQIGGTATDLLKNTPTVVVDADGAITIRGKSPLILINGRNSSLSATDRIPASSIESIEIINNPTAQYDADAEGGIINIKLKKNISNGTNGATAIGAGYGAKGRINSSFIINHQVGKWNYGFAYDNRFANRTRSAISRRTSFDMPAEYYLLQNRFDKRYEQTQNLKLNVDYTLNDKNSFGLEAIGNLDGQDNNETLGSLITSNTNTFTSNNSRNSIELGREKVAEIALNYERKFTNVRKHLAINTSTYINYETENTNITTQLLSSTIAQLDNPYLQRTNNYQNSNVTNYKIDYTLPLTSKTLLSTGYKAITRYTNASYKNQNYIGNEYITNALASTTFNFKEQIHAGYLQYSGFVGTTDSTQLKYDVGLRAEEVLNAGNTSNNATAFNRSYFNVFPTANIAYYLAADNYFKLSFSRRINRPGLGQLNPFVDVTDALNTHGGNPNLRPELVNATEGGYSKEWKKVSLSSTLYYRYATNSIRNIVVLQSNGVALTSPINIGNVTTYGYEGIFTLYPTKVCNVNLSASIYQQRISGGAINPTIANNVLSWYCKLITNIDVYTNTKLQIIGNYNSPIASPQGQSLAVYNIDMGFQQKIIRGKGALGIVLTDVFNTQKSGRSAYGNDFSYNRTFKIDTRALLVTFAYTFGTKFNEELMENKFSNE